MKAKGIKFRKRQGQGKVLQVTSAREVMCKGCYKGFMIKSIIHD